MRFPPFQTLAMVLGIASFFFAAIETQAGQRTVKIGFQKSSTLIMILKAQGKLEQALAKTGVKLEWAEFMAGPPLLEALNVGAVDMTADVADTVPLFAQAAGARLVYLAQEAPSPTAQGILVAKDSPLKAPTDLRGKRVAVTKGTGGHYLLIAALSREGLQFNDITPVYLSPADGRAAFERGSVDAWVTWDPFLSAGQFQAGARVLTDGQGIASYQRYYLASEKFAAELPDVCSMIFDHLQQTGRWVKDHPAEAAALLAPIWGLDAKIVEQANFRRSYEVRPVKKEYLGEQQIIADSFFSTGIFPKRVDAASAEIWQPSS
jgi:sulfonate transport system substrate-binding protein